MKVIKFMQEGGNMPSAPAQGAPAGDAGGNDPIMQIADIFSQALQSGDCNMLAQGAEMFIQLVSQAMGQGGPQGPVDQAPEGEPVFKKGGKIMRRKCAKKENGGKASSLANLKDKNLNKFASKK